MNIFDLNIYFLLIFSRWKGQLNGQVCAKEIEVVCRVMPWHVSPLQDWHTDKSNVGNSFWKKLLRFTNVWRTQMTEKIFLDCVLSPAILIISVLRLTFRVNRMLRVEAIKPFANAIDRQCGIRPVFTDVIVSFVKRSFSNMVMAFALCFINRRKFTLWCG